MSGAGVRKVLSVDIGGTHVKALCSGGGERVKFKSGPGLTPAAMVQTLQETVRHWDFDAVSLGYPGPVLHSRIIVNAAHLGPGWIAFDFGQAFGRPVKIINDAAMQALGAYPGRGRMLFLGLGTGMGSAMIVEGELEPLELAHLPYKKDRSYEDYVGKAGLKRLGKKRWRKHVWEVVLLLRQALEPDLVVIGGGNAKLLDTPPKGVRLGDNADAFEGGFRLWREG